MRSVYSLTALLEIVRWCLCGWINWKVYIFICPSEATNWHVILEQTQPAGNDFQHFLPLSPSSRQKLQSSSIKIDSCHMERNIWWWAEGHKFQIDSCMSLFLFFFPLSPLQAVLICCRPINPDKIVEYWKCISKCDLAEGREKAELHKTRRSKLTEVGWICSRLMNAKPMSLHKILFKSKLNKNYVWSGNVYVLLNMFSIQK